MRTTTISKHLGSFIVIGVMLITAPATIGFASRIFGWDSLWGALRSVLLIFVTEIAALIWHRASKSLARGEAQHSIAGVMTWVSLFGVIAMAGVEIVMEFATKGETLASGTGSTMSIAGLGVLIILMAANLASGIAFQNADPDHVQRRNEERLNEAAEAVQTELADRTVETVRRAMYDQREQLIAPRVNAILNAMMSRQTLLAERDAKNLLDTSHRNVIEGTARPAPTTMAYAKDGIEDGEEAPTAPKS